MVQHEDDFVEGLEEIDVVVTKLLYFVHELNLKLVSLGDALEQRAVLLK